MGASVPFGLEARLEAVLAGFDAGTDGGSEAGSVVTAFAGPVRSSSTAESMAGVEDTQVGASVPSTGGVARSGDGMRPSSTAVSGTAEAVVGHGAEHGAGRSVGLADAFRALSLVIFGLGN